MSVVIISTITFVLSTLPQLATNLDLILFENKSVGEADLPVERWEKVSNSYIRADTSVLEGGGIKTFKFDSSHSPGSNDSKNIQIGSEDPLEVLLLKWSISDQREAKKTKEMAIISEFVLIWP